MPEKEPTAANDRDLGAIMGLLPMDIIESVIISLIKVLGEQPAIETLLGLSKQVASANDEQQAMLTQQLVLHNLSTAGTVKCLEMLMQIDAAAETAPQRLKECLETIQYFQRPTQSQPQG